MCLPSSSPPSIRLLIQQFGITQQNVDPLLEIFCSSDLIDKEIKFLLKNPRVIDISNIELMVQIAIHANCRDDPLIAYKFHRKSVILSLCHSHGLNFLRSILSDPEGCIVFLELTGSPPGQGSDYWARLVDAYNRGDNFLAFYLRNKNNIDLTPRNGENRANDSEFLLPPVVIPLIPKDGKNIAIESIKEQILRKYLSIDGDKDIMDNLGMSNFYLESLQKKRDILFQIISNDQLMVLFNDWICGMTSEELIQYLNTTMDQWLNLYSPFDEYLSFRQRIMSLSEFLDCNLLVADRGQLLLETLVRIALGKENKWSENSRVLIEIIGQELENFSKNHSPTLLESLEWISNQEMRNWSYPLAFIKLEYMTEQLIISQQPHEIQQLIMKKTNFEKFAFIFKTYRTRSIQLVMLGLFQHLKTSLVKNYQKQINL